MGQTCTSNSFRGSVLTKTILEVHSQDGSSAWASRTPFVPMCRHGRTRACSGAEHDTQGPLEELVQGQAGGGGVKGAHIGTRRFKIYEEL